MRVMRRIVGVGGVEFLEQGKGLGLVLRGQHGGQLGVEGRVVGRFFEGGAEKCFGLGILLSRDEQVGQAGIGGGGVWIFGEQAAVGGLGAVRTGRRLRQVRRPAGCRRAFRG